MVTKCIVIGEQLVDTRKRITFEHILLANFSITRTGMTPENYKYIELICKDYAPGRDLMFAYNDPTDRGKGSLIGGQWNDGVA